MRVNLLADDLEESVLVVHNEALMEGTRAECVQMRDILMRSSNGKAERYVIQPATEFYNKHGGRNEEATEATDSKATSR